MKKFLVLAILAATAAFAATNSSLRSPTNAADGTNDLGFHRWQSSTKTVAQGDTLFGLCSQTGSVNDSLCNTSNFTVNRNAIIIDGMNKGSAVVARNPDSIICLLGIQRVDSDTSDINYGMQFNLGTASTPNWVFYGAAASGTTGTNVALTFYRLASRFVPNTQYRWFYNGVTATDTTAFKYANCMPKFVP